MEKAYIILAHQRPEQLARLVRALEDGESSFFIHLDRRCSVRNFRAALKGCQNWKLVRSEDGGWGKFGIVKGTLNALHAIGESGKKFGVVNLISGQDYPLHSNVWINRFFEQHAGRIFMEFWTIPAAHWPQGGMDRILDYHFGDRRRRSRIRFSRWVSRWCNDSVLLRRRFPKGLKPYGGWQWWSLPMSAVQEILRFVAARPDYVRYHRFSLLPDEMFFQTILLNSDSPEIQGRLVNNCLRFVDWDNPNPCAPATISQRYFDALIASKCLFTRKFDESVDPGILDALDRFRLEETSTLERLDSSQWPRLSHGPDFPFSSASPNTKRGLFDEPRSVRP